MNKIVDYLNVVAVSYWHLDGEVKAKLNEGWIPLGGISYIPNTGTCLQTMVKYQES